MAFEKVFFEVFFFLFFDFGVESAAGKNLCILSVKFLDFFEVEKPGTVGEGVQGADANCFVFYWVVIVWCFHGISVRFCGDTPNGI